MVEALRHFQAKEYSAAEADLRRVEFLAPSWPPLRFNLGVAAEGQGRLADAIREYRAFVPSATADQRQLTELRIHELEALRTSKYASSRILRTRGILMTSFGTLAIAGFISMFAIGLTLADEKKGVTVALSSALVSIPGVVLLGFGIPAILQAKRIQRSLALGPTRLRMTGSGLALHF